MRMLSLACGLQRPVLSLTPGYLLSTQIFSSVECFRILSEELFRIQDARSPALGAEAIDDDVHRWSIELRGFEPSSDLVHDLQECKRRWGFDHIELRLVFKEDLYPFYPPRLSVVCASASVLR